MNIAEMSWSDFKQSADKAGTALVPVGSVEGYGHHLPLGTDGLVALALAKAVGDRIQGLVAPLIPVGWTAVMADFPGSLSVPTSALQAYCRGIAQSLLACGLRRVIFVNGHAGNINALDELCFELAAVDRNAVLACINVWQFIQPLSGDLLDSAHDKFGHGGELNTSVMLYLYPEFVNRQQVASVAPLRPGDPAGIARPIQFSAVGPTGSIGDATLGSAQKGHRIFELAVEKILVFLAENHTSR